MQSRRLELPTERSATSKQVAAAAGRLSGLARREGPVLLRARADGAEVEVELPPEALRTVILALEAFADGSSVTLMAPDAELTTQQAADYLCVSRPHVVKLMESGALPFRKVGTHRRVSLPDLEKYDAKERARRQPLLDELAALSQEIEEER